MKWFSEVVKEALDKASGVVRTIFVRDPVCPSCGILLFPYIALAEVRFLAYDDKNKKEVSVIPVWACPSCEYVKANKWGIELWEWCQRIEPLKLQIILKELSSMVEMGLGVRK